jgi:hypothetical protein
MREAMRGDQWEWEYMNGAEKGRNQAKDEI